MASLKAVRAGKKLFLSEMPGRFKDKVWAIRKIEEATKPSAEARRLINWFQAERGVYKGATNLAPDETRDQPELSDVQELRVRLYQRNGSRGWSPSDPQYRLLNRLERDVAQGLVAWPAYRERAAYIERAGPGLPNSYFVEQENILKAGKTNLFSDRPLPASLQMNKKEY